MRTLRAEELLDQFADALIAVEPDGRVLFWSGGAEQVFGYSRAEAVGRMLVDLVVPEERRGEEAERIRTAMETGVASFESVRRRKNGSDVHVDVTMRAVLDPDGAIRHVAISKKDVSYLTYQREASVVAARVGGPLDAAPDAMVLVDRQGRIVRESKFRGLLEAAPDAIVIVDRSGRIVIVNAQAESLFGYARAELIGQPVEMLVPRQEREGHRGHRDGYFAAPRPRPMGSRLELHAVRKDGSQFPVEISLSPLETEDGILVSSSIRDVTARKETENALKLAYEELESFSYSIAHDLRAPLRGMNGFAQILLDDYHDKLGDEGLDCLREIRNNALRMSALIDALLGLSRVARSEIRRVRVDLGQVARSLAARLAAIDSERAVQLEIEDGLIVWADPTLARTLLDNLIGNAWKFTGPTSEPRIEVGAVVREGRRTFFVRDNGAGFDMAHAGRLFGAFQRLHTEREFPGTGIGLATAQRIVHRHGGTIWAEGTVGAGASFFFTLPAEERAEQ